MGADPHIVVAGAGALGCYLGGMLCAAGLPVTLLVRPRVAAELRAHGLTLTDFEGAVTRVSMGDLTLSEDAACLSEAQIVLVTVRAAATTHMGAQIAQHAADGARILTLQNGPTQAALLRRRLPEADLSAGIVPFGVVPMGQGCFHRAGGGAVLVGGGETDLAKALGMPQVPMQNHSDITRLQWGQLLINLSHAVAALSGLSLHAQLSTRAWRKLLAAQWEEALGILHAAGADPVMHDHITAAKTPRVLRYPTPLFKQSAGYMLSRDRQALGPVAQDLLAGVPSEVDTLQGEVVRIAHAIGQPAPINAHVQELVHLAQTAALGLPNLPPSALWPDA